LSFGLDVARSALEAQATALSIWANDVANASTPGYMAQLPAFTEALRTAQPAAAIGPLAGLGPTVGLGSGVLAQAVEEVGTSLTPTGRPLDVAIRGPGYLVALAAGGQRVLLRGASLRVNAQGELTDAQGALVLSRALRPIRLPPGIQPQVVDGVIQAPGVAIALAVAQVANPGGLVDVGQGHYVATAAAGPVTVAAPTPGQVVEGYQNASPVPLSQALTGLVDVQAGFELAAKVAAQAQTLASLTSAIPQP
jgi:flagellar basal-body rod protein FlgG